MRTSLPRVLKSGCDCAPDPRFDALISSCAHTRLQATGFRLLAGRLPPGVRPGPEWRARCRDVDAKRPDVNPAAVLPSLCGETATGASQFAQLRFDVVRGV